ncbi:uracil phosphoribosyltransferase [Sungkyunkwania multivorans]|uniref:Uracil phosphoribosyltransferase n=1 Tax=Sungkyunkwania multivorans TaxID=1173618 RepID=A0ABW3CZJ3_9FLAO
MHIHNLSESPSILNQFISEIRDVRIQKDRMRFRRNIERIGEILAYELSKSLSFAENKTKTPLGMAKTPLVEDEVVICSILRAGLPLHRGLLNYFDQADNTFISAYRHHHKSDPKKFEVIVEYLASPSLEGKTLIIADPMLASGKSMVMVNEALQGMGTPKEIHLVSVVGALTGVEYAASNFSEDTHLWIAAIDPTLNDYGYIVPGLGDAGDLSFGNKVQH